MPSGRRRPFTGSGETCWLAQGALVEEGRARGLAYGQTALHWSDQGVPDFMGVPGFAAA